jgi:hypothetical protein
MIHRDPTPPVHENFADLLGGRMNETTLSYLESRISAHHNYLLNGMLTPGFLMGKPDTRKRFYFLADVVLPGESTPRISARLFNEKGELLVELNWNRIRKNPGSCTYRPVPGGFRLLDRSDEAVLEVKTQAFANGYLTRISGRLHDEQGRLRMEPLGDSIKICGEPNALLDTPLGFEPR